MASKPKAKHKRKESIPRDRSGRKSDAWRWPRIRDKPGGRDKTFGDGTQRYEPSLAERARVLCASSAATDWVLAREFGVCRNTIRTWRADHPEFAEACKIGKDTFDDAVEAALGDRALGYDYIAQKLFFRDGKVVRAEVLEHIPADPAAALNWLKNRRPERWREQSHLRLMPPTKQELTDWELAKSLLFDLEQSARRENTE